MEPREGLCRLVEFTFDFHDTQRDFVQLIAGENISGGTHAEHLKAFKARNSSVVKTISNLIGRGIAAKVFRDDVEPVDLHLMISSLCFIASRTGIRSPWRSDAIPPSAIARAPSGDDRRYDLAVHGALKSSRS